MKGDLTMAQLSKALFSSTKEDWATPQDFFDKLDEEFHFDLDPCADAENAKCKEYFTKEENGLLKDWGGRRVFCNPPYDRTSTGEWIYKTALDLAVEAIQTAAMARKGIISSIDLRAVDQCLSETERRGEL